VNQRQKTSPIENEVPESNLGQKYERLGMTDEQESRQLKYNSAVKGILTRANLNIRIFDELTK